MFTRIRKLISKRNGNQDVYIEQMSREGTIPFNKEETMKLYHTETQEDYNALMHELEEEDYKWNEVEKATENNAWDVFKDNTVVIKECDADLGIASKGYCERIYIDTPIQKYKAQQDSLSNWVYSDAAKVFFTAN